MKKLNESKIFRYIVCPLFLMISIIWLPISMRLMGVALLIGLIIAYVTISWHKRASLIIVLWIVFLIFTVLPFDITFKNVPGPPRFVPYIKGYPTKEAFEKAKRGDVILGGCNVTGFEPKWVLVW